MRLAPVLLLATLVTAPAHAIPGPPCNNCALATISSITFTGTGTVSFTSGPLAPALNSANTISGAIAMGNLVAFNATGTYNMATYANFWSIQDSFIVNADSSMPGSFGSIDLLTGGLAAFNFNSGVFTEFLSITETGFVGFIFDPFNSANDSSYSGNWTVGSSVIARTAGAIPEPASWALMISGFALVGLALRSSRRRTPQAI